MSKKQVGELFIGVRGSVDKFTKDMAQIGKEVKKFGHSMKKVTGDLAGFSLPLAGIAGGALKMAADFESAMNKVSAKGGIVGNDLATLNKEALRLGAETQYSAREAAEGMGELAAAGFNTTKIMAAMPGVLNLAAVEQLEIGRAAEIAVATLGQFGLKAEESSHVVDILAKAASSGSLSIEDLAATLKYVGPVANSVGYSLEETSAAIALLSNAGIKNSEAGTALRAGILRLINPPKEAAASLKQLGVEVRDASGKMLSLDDIIKQFVDSGARVEHLSEIVGQEAVAAWSALTNMVRQNRSALEDVNKEVKDNEGFSTSAANTINSGFNGALERMSGSVETAATKLGELLSPAAHKVADTIGMLADKLSGFVDAFKELPEFVQVGVGAFAGLGAALLGISAVAGPVAIAIGTIGSSAVLITAGVAAAGAAIFTFISHNETAQRVVKHVWDSIVATLKDNLELWTTVFGGAIDVVTGFKDAVASVLAPVQDSLGLIGSVARAVGEEFAKSVGTEIPAATDKASESITSMSDNGVSVFGTFSAFLRETSSSVTSFVADEFRDLADDLQSVFKSMSDTVTEFLQGTFVPEMKRAFGQINELLDKMPGIDVFDDVALEHRTNFAKLYKGVTKGLADHRLEKEAEAQKKINALQEDAQIKNAYDATDYRALYGDRIAAAKQLIEAETRLASPLAAKPAGSGSGSKAGGDAADRIGKAERAADALSDRMRDVSDEIEDAQYKLGEVRDPLADKLQALIESQDFEAIKTLGADFAKTEEGLDSFGKSFDRAREQVKKLADEKKKLAKASDDVREKIAEAFGGQAKAQVSELASTLTSFLSSGNEAGLQAYADGFITSAERATEFNDALAEAGAHLKSLEGQASAFGDALSSAIAGVVAELGVNGDLSKALGDFMGSAVSGQSSGGTFGQWGAAAGNWLGGWFGSGGSEAQNIGPVADGNAYASSLGKGNKTGPNGGNANFDWATMIAGAGEAIGGLMNSEGDDKQKALDAYHTTGRAVTNAFVPGLGDAITAIREMFPELDKFDIGTIVIESLFSEHAGTTARKTVERWIENKLMEGGALSLYDSDGKLRPWDGNIMRTDPRVEGGNPFTNEGWADDYNGGTNSVFDGLGKALQKLLGITEDVGGQIGYMLSLSLGENVDNARLMVQQLGLSLEELEKPLLESALAGEMSWHDYNVAVQGVTEAFKEGRAEWAVYEQAFNSLIASGGRGSAALKDFRDIAVEGLEAGAKTMEDLKARLIKDGANPEEVQALFQAAAQRGIETLEGWKDASDATAGAIVGDMYALSGSLAKRWDEMAKTLVDIETKLAAIPDKVEKSVVFNVEVNDPSGMLEQGDAKINAGNVKAFAKGGIVDGATLFNSRGGLGIMGEAGPEAILPLTRMGGKLGVNASGLSGGGGTVIYQVDARGAQAGVGAEIRRELARIEENAVRRAVDTIYESQRRGGW